jgi:hypothetical protein
MAYGTIAAWRTYATARGNAAPAAATDELATAALTRASDYIRFRYVANLLASYEPLTFTPAGYDLPLVVEATYIAASFELATPGFFSKTYTSAEQKVLTEVKGIKWTVTGDSSKTYAAMPSSTLIDAMFEPYVINRDDDQFMFMSIGPGGRC